MGVAVTPIGAFVKKPRVTVKGTAGQTLIDAGLDDIRAAFVGAERPSH